MTLNYSAFNKTKQPVPGEKPVQSMPTVNISKKNLGKGFFDYFLPQPSGKVRPIDVVRELPEAISNVGQSIVRSGVSVGAFLRDLVTKGEVNFDAKFQATNQLDVNLLGTDKPVGFETVGLEIQSIFGVDKPNAFTIPLGVMVASLDVYPGTAGKESLIEETAKKIAKTTDEKSIVNFLKSIFKASDEALTPLAKGLSKIDDVGKTRKIIKDAIKGVEKVPKITLSKSVEVPPKPTRVPQQLRDGLSLQLRKAEFRKPDVPVVAKTEAQLLKDKLKNLARGSRIGKVETKKNIKSLQSQIVRYIEKNLPVSQRGKFVRTVTNTQTPTNLAKAFENVSRQVIKYQQAQKIGKELGTTRSKIAFIRKVGEFNQTAVSEIKKQAGLDKPLRKASQEQLDQVVSGLKERLKFKFSKGFRPEVVEKTSKPTALTDEFYQAVREFEPSRSTGAKESLKEAGGELGKGADVFMGTISTRLKNIDPSLRTALRKFEFKLLNTTNKDRKAVELFSKTVEKVFKANKTDFKELDSALKNGDVDVATRIAEKHGFTKELNSVRTLLDDLYKRANEVGFDIGYQKNYFPRTIKDPAGFLEYFQKQGDWSLIDEVVKRKEMDLGRYLTVEEKSQLVNTMIRGYSGGNITLSGTGAMKSRVIDKVTPELNEFYDDFVSSLQRYVVGTNEAIEARRFFGKELRLDENGIKQGVNIDDSIGAYIVKLMAEGKITPSQEKELSSILKARFNEGRIGGFWSLYKNLTYIDVMGSPFNAVTQVGDLAFTLYEGGLRRGGKEILKGLVGKSKIKKEDIGIEKIAEEFGMSPGSRLLEKASRVAARAVDKVFRIVGLEKMDTLGKNSLINTIYDGLVKDAEVGGKKLINTLADTFGEEAPRVMQEIKSGQVTDDVKFLLFNRLLDFQPIAKSEVPEKYLSSGNGKIFYQLKTWTLKMFDVYRNEVFDEMRYDRVQGVKNMVRLTTALVLMNATADEIKDVMLGKESNFKDRATDQMLKLVGFSRYTAYQAQRQGVGSTLAEQILPATAFADNVTKDIFDSWDESVNVNKLRTIQSIPVGGKLYYWWFGKGLDSSAKKKSGIDVEIPEVNIPEVNVKIPEIEIPNVEI